MNATRDQAIFSEESGNPDELEINWHPVELAK